MAQVMPAPVAIRKFCGYGSLSADLWFLGFEESTGERSLQSRWSFEFEMSVREKWEPVMDVRVACGQLRDEYWLSNGYSTVWKHMSKLARGLLDAAADWNDMACARQYVVDALGRSTGNTLLGDLLPLPAPHTSDWPAAYRIWYVDRDAYDAAEYPTRTCMWRALIQRHEPKYLCCYGTGTANEQWDRYRALLDASSWEELASGRVLRAVSGGTTAFLLPFLGQGQLRLTDLHAVIASVHPDLAAQRPPSGVAASDSSPRSRLALSRFEQLLEGLDLRRRQLKHFTKYFGPSGEDGPGVYLEIRSGFVTRVDLSRITPPAHCAVCGPRRPNGGVTAEIDFAQDDDAILEAFALFAERVARGA